MPTTYLFDQDEQILLRRLAGEIISASLELQLPGADDEIIFARFLERAKQKSSSLSKSMHDFFQEFGGIAKVSALDNKAFKQFASKIQTKRHSFLFTMMTLVAQSYYEDPRILKSLGKTTTPPFPLGHPLDQSDWSLLDNVKKRETIYRKC